jgi:hypothetical protein
MNPMRLFIIKPKVMMVLLLAVTIVPLLHAQKNHGSLKIGTYDSRVIVFAYSRSDYFKQHQLNFQKQNDSAQKAHDTVKIRELSIQAMSFQHLLHLMVFGSGTTSAIIALVKDKLPELAKKAGVSIILCKWELNYDDPAVDTVDITVQVAQLFKPEENIDKMIMEIRNTAPVPLEELTIEEDMLTLYCERFGRK